MLFSRKAELEESCFCILLWTLAQNNCFLYPSPLSSPHIHKFPLPPPFSHWNHSSGFPPPTCLCVFISADEHPTPIYIVWLCSNGFHEVSLVAIYKSKLLHCCWAIPLLKCLSRENSTFPSAFIVNSFSSSLSSCWSPSLSSFN